MNSLEKIKCPTCGKNKTWIPENKYKPFCSDRCKLIDLGEWAHETRKIPSDPIDFNSISDDDANDSGDHFF
jgi:endogenous inhibitor of DNA gyrase (YacG/DUF329 family)